MANYNGASHLAEAIGSAQRQTLTDWELILVDDASVDDSVAIAQGLAETDPRIRVLVQPRNQGPAAARNRALDAARGDWVAIVDSDDVMQPLRLERLLARARRQGAEIVADNQLVCSADLAPVSRFLTPAVAERLARLDLERFIDSGRLYSRWPDLGVLKPMVRRALIARTGARYDESLRIAEDFHFVVMLMAAGAELHLEPEPLYLYRKHAGSISHRLTGPLIAAMIAADRAARERLQDQPGAGRALERRIAGLKSWAVHERVMAAAKARRWFEAARIALERPHAWRLISRPLLERMVRRAGGASTTGRALADSRSAGNYSGKFQQRAGTMQ